MMKWWEVWHMIWYDMIWYDMIWYDMIRYDTIRYDTIRYDTIRYDTIRYDKFVNCNWIDTCSDIFKLWSMYLPKIIQSLPADPHSSTASSRLNWHPSPPVDLNGPVLFAERPYLVSTCVPSHFKCSLHRVTTELWRVTPEMRLIQDPFTTTKCQWLDVRNKRFLILSLGMWARLYRNAWAKWTLCVSPWHSIWMLKKKKIEPRKEV